MAIRYGQDQGRGIRVDIRILPQVPGNSSEKEAGSENDDVGVAGRLQYPLLC